MSVLIATQQLTAGSALRSWHADPAGITVVVVAGALYGAGVRRVRRLGHDWPVARTLVFVLLGLGSLLLATVGWVGVYATSLFWMYTVQFLALLLLAPVLMAFGRPLALARLAQPDRLGWLDRLANPLVGPALVPVLTLFVFFTPLLRWSLEDAAVGGLLRVALVAVGLVFALPLAGEGRDSGSIAVAAAVFVGFLELLADAVPGILVRLHDQLLTTYFADLHRGWGLSPLIDQHRAGSILWVVAEALDLPFLALLVVQWIRSDEREAARIDSQLDAVERRPVAATAGVAEPELDDGRVRPWWETDASVLGSTRAAQLRREQERR
jgi:putative membrane protein